MRRVLFIWLVLFAASVIAHADNPKQSYWNQQRRGANGDGGVECEAWFSAADSVGIEFVRLCPATWKGTGRDFLIGDADNYEGIPPADLKRLQSTLDIAEKHGVKIVLTMFSMPGQRWRQDNGDKFDYRIWTDSTQQKRALKFCSDIARAIGSHPSLVGYNLLNEPHPERADGYFDDVAGFNEWRASKKGSLADLNRFNRLMVEAIRSVDSLTPIILDGCFHASPTGLSYLEPVADSNTIYSFHFYEPWDYVTFRANNGHYCYPTSMPEALSDGRTIWTDLELRYRLRRVDAWAYKNSIPASRIMVGEFGCDRRVCGAQAYLDDALNIFEHEGWHWAFYSFRSSDWDGLDYELGTEKLGWKYWQAIDSGATHEQLVNRRENPLWNVIHSRLQRHSTP